VTGTDQLEVVARDGTEPSTRGFQYDGEAGSVRASRRQGTLFRWTDRTAARDRTRTEPRTRLYSVTCRFTMGRDQELPTQRAWGVFQTRHQDRNSATARVQAEAATDGTGCREEAERSRSTRVAPAFLDRRAEGFPLDYGQRQLARDFQIRWAGRRTRRLFWTTS